METEVAVKVEPVYPGQRIEYAVVWEQHRLGVP